MKENNLKLETIDRSIKKFEMKLIRMQGKHPQNKIKPLIKKINLLKSKYSDLYLKLESKGRVNIKPVEIGKVPDLPSERKNSIKMRDEELRIIPNSLELPDITSEAPEIDMDLPGPIPNAPTGMRRMPETKKEGFFEHIGKEVKKFLHMSP